MMLHGGMGSGESFFQLFEALNRSLRLLAPNVPGSARTMEQAVAGHAAVLDSAGVDRVHLFGHSQGGYVAQRFARAYPNRVATLILSSTCPPSAAHGKKVAAQLRTLHLLPECLIRFAISRRLRKLVLTNAPELNPDERAFWEDYLRSNAAEAGIKQRALAAAMLQLDYHRGRPFTVKDLEHWPGRVLILDCTGDALMGLDDLGGLIELYPGATRHTCRGAGHLSIVARTEEYAAAILQAVGGARRG